MSLKFLKETGLTNATCLYLPITRSAMAFGGLPAGRSATIFLYIRRMRELFDVEAGGVRSGRRSKEISKEIGK